VRARGEREGEEGRTEATDLVDGDVEGLEDRGCERGGRVREVFVHSRGGRAGRTLVGALLSRVAGGEDADELRRRDDAGPAGVLLEVSSTVAARSRRSMRTYMTPWSYL